MRLSHVRPRALLALVALVPRISARCAIMEMHGYVYYFSLTHAIIFLLKKKLIKYDI